MTLVVYLFVALLALSAIVFFHELGHFLVARAVGVKVERFSIGFGKILAKKWCCGTEWVFSAIPMGGYVKMKGQDDSDPTKRDYSPDSYTSKSPWQRILILLAGPFANVVLAFFAFVVIGFAGKPVNAVVDYVPPVIGKVASDTPAQKAGLKEGDKILAIDGISIKYWYQIGEIVQQEQDPITLDILRDGKVEHIRLYTKDIETKNIYQESIHRKIIGIAPKVDRDTVVHFTPKEAFLYAFEQTWKWATIITKSVQKIGTGEVGTENVGGVITIFDILIKFAQAGFLNLLFISAIISVNLGVLNLLPIPALDGGHILFNLYEIVTKKELSEKAYYRLTIAGWIFLGGLMMLGIYNDVNRLTGGN